MTFYKLVMIFIFDVSKILLNMRISFFLFKTELAKWAVMIFEKAVWFGDHCS